jgi:hypothetical protein
MMIICAHCGLPLPEEEDFDGSYCDRSCFDAAIDMAIALDAAEPKPAIVKQKGCKLRNRIGELCDDAEKRVSNIDSHNTHKLKITRAYFQSRADVLNDLLAFMAPSEAPCSCC